MDSIGKDWVAPSPPVARRMGLASDTLARLQALERYDLSFLTNAFNDRMLQKGRRFAVEQIYPIQAHFGRADEEIAKRLELEFKRFVAITLLRPGAVHAPSGPVDMYWHFFILHTKEYKQFCDDIWWDASGMPPEMPAARACLETERLRLRPFEPGDASEVQQLAGDADVARWLTLVPHPYPEGFALAWIKTHAMEYRNGTKVIYAVTRLEDGRLLGCAQLGIFRPNDRGELGYWLGQAHWGRGYATEAGRALLAYGFTALGLHRIQARHFTTNPSSARVLLKLGMKHEGTLRHDLKRDGRYWDSELYSVLAGEATQATGA